MHFLSSFYVLYLTMSMRNESYDEKFNMMNIDYC